MKVYKDAHMKISPYIISKHILKKNTVLEASLIFQYLSRKFKCSVTCQKQLNLEYSIWKFQKEYKQLVTVNMIFQKVQIYI